MKMWCERCGKSWEARVKDPVQCPFCKRYDWNTKGGLPVKFGCPVCENPWKTCGCLVKEMTEQERETALVKVNAAQRDIRRRITDLNRRESDTFNQLKEARLKVQGLTDKMRKDPNYRIK